MEHIFIQNILRQSTQQATPSDEVYHCPEFRYDKFAFKSLVYALVLADYGRITLGFFIYLYLLIMHREKRADRGPHPYDTA